MICVKKMDLALGCLHWDITPLFNAVHWWPTFFWNTWTGITKQGRHGATKSRMEPTNKQIPCTCRQYHNPVPAPRWRKIWIKAYQLHLLWVQHDATWYILPSLNRVGNKVLYKTKSFFFKYSRQNTCNRKKNFTMHLLCSVLHSYYNMKTVIKSSIHSKLWKFTPLAVKVTPRFL